MRIGLKLSQTELAEMLGVTREAINKQLQNWSKANLVRVERGFITVTDRVKLATLARSDDDD
jgi:CRP-like cAMP-binding protein